MQITVTAGKGGTGKTTVATNFASALSDSNQVQLLDCDVEEPDAHIFLDPEFETQESVSMMRPQIDQDACTNCGQCAEQCNYNALAVLPDQVMVYPELCHGCGLCPLVCPEDAISEIDHQIGTIDLGSARGFEFMQGTLTIGDPIAPPIIDKLKDHIKPDYISILDSPPGTACPAVETLYGSDAAILVTEPTPFGLHDLKLTIEVCRDFEIPFGVVINRKGIGNADVESYCKSEGIPILLEIPDSREIAEWYSDGILFVDKMPEWKERFSDLYDQVNELTQQGRPEPGDKTHSRGSQ